MTETIEPQNDETAIASKIPAPGLTARAPRPRVVRLRGAVVRTFVIGGAVLVSGSLVWAFIVQPELKAADRTRQIEAREEQARGLVRPAEAVTEQPASYDRLPPPRGGGDDPADAAATPAASDRPSAYVGTPGFYGADAARRPGPSVRELAAGSSLFFASSATGSGDGDLQSPAAPVRPGPIERSTGLERPLSPYELKAGALVPAALLTAVDTARAGPVVATVTQNVYDTVTGRYLLVPQGTRLIGRSGGDSAYGDRRAFLTWERMILPNGRSLLLESEAGVDAQGAIGVRGEVDRRLLPLLVATVLSGAVTTLGQIARDDEGSGSGGLIGNVGDATAIEGARIGGRLIDRELEVRPSIRLQAGAAVRVLITRDLVLEPYRP